MIELKCKSCGGNLEIDETKEFGTCPYCKAKYKINEDQKVVFSIDENTKEAIEKGYKLFGKISLTFLIPFLIILAVAIAIIVFAATNISKSYKKSSDSIMKASESIIDKTSENMNRDYNNMMLEQQQIAQKSTSDFERKSFNGKIEIYVGTAMGGNVKALIDAVVTSNKTNDRKITVSYNDIDSSDTDELVELKDDIDTFANYEVELNYDNDNYVYEAIIEKK